MLAVSMVLTPTSRPDSSTASWIETGFKNSETAFIFCNFSRILYININCCILLDTLQFEQNAHNKDVFVMKQVCK
jgi:hypothetical protein